jgi:N-methylhydantoinase B/oxoprolinase/acetone carboxylase alpha subunit
MKKAFTLLLTMIILSISMSANETKPISKSEFMKQFLKLKDRERKAEQRIKDAKAKTKALKKLEKAVDELSSKLNVDK